MSSFRVCVVLFLVTLASNACGAKDPIARLAVSGLGTNENIGSSVATDGQLVLIGNGAGSAFLFDAFTQQQLAVFDSTASRYKASVALEGTTAVVGVRNGAIVYDFSDLSNIVETHLIPDEGLHYAFGVSVDISGDTVIVGASDDNYAGSFTGSAFLFDRTTGTQIAKLVANDGEALDNFGISVAIDGNRAVVGSVKANNGQGDGHGGVYLYDASSGIVSDRLIAKYTSPLANSSATPNFGYSVDISGDSLIAYETHGPGQTFLWKTGEQPVALPGSAAWRIAYHSLSINGDLAAVGFYPSNRVALYDGSRNQVGSVRSPELGATNFGASVALAGDLLVVGSPGSEGRGAVYVYLVDDLLVPEPATGMMIVCATLLIISRRSCFPNRRL